MTFKTEKLFYQFPYGKRAKTQFEKREGNTIALARSIAYPEGGGQLGDKGVVKYQAITLPFIDTQKSVGMGRSVVRKDFPLINVEGEVRLTLAQENFDLLPDSGEIEVEIDLKNRCELTISHTISHVVYMGMTELRNAVPETTFGCLIGNEGGRFDVGVEKFLEDDVKFIKLFVENSIQNKDKVEIVEIPGEPECRIWQMNGISIPCGGTHLEALYDVGDIHIKRKGKSKGIERIYFEIKNVNLTPLLARFQDKLV
ncbi:alanyl-tRNA editing protein [Fluviispira sanaruensis]|uniref:Alanyl-tRNA editing protein n=2 Tax=Fluviispira sanaruensis TaxID=2493639 RepID=A0A4P2VLK8_FLUSA|nr:alanyl-tRNA editing protein [Fluviispira sanaruensis]